MLKKDKPKANKAIHCLWLQAHDGLANEYWIQTLRNEDWAQHFKLVRLAVIKMKPTLGTSIPFPASLACQLEIKNWNYFCMLVDVCSNFRKKKLTRPTLAEFFSFPKSTVGELQPCAKDSVQGIPIAAIISVPISGRQCFWLHLGQEKVSLLVAKKNVCLFLMLGAKLFHRQKCQKMPKTWNLSSSKRPLEVVNVGSEPSFVLTRPRFTSGCGFWERSLKKKLADGWPHLTVWGLSLSFIHWLSISPIGGTYLSKLKRN